MHKSSDYIDYWEVAFVTLLLHWFLIKEEKDIGILIDLIHKGFDLDILKIEHLTLQCKQSHHTRSPSLYIQVNYLSNSFCIIKVRSRIVSFDFNRHL